MPIRRPAAGLAAVVILGIIGGSASAAGGPADVPQHDPHSRSNPDQIRVTHLKLDLEVDFGLRQLRGDAALDVQRRPGCPPGTPLVLDTRGLDIRRVRAAAPGGEPADVPFRLGAADPILGTPLEIGLPDDASSVVIEYRTATTATALQWVEPAGTAGGARPFLFTQSQAIHARSWVPIQDSPGVRITFEATIRAPEGFRAVMAAEERIEPEPAPRGDRPGSRPFGFRMTKPIPPYLLALAVGDLEFRALGERTGVFAEPKIIDAAAAEFADTESMLETAERLFGPYRWGRYDLLVLPPSFPYGGMENPCVTFATPTVLAGDRSLVALVVHELAHSWSGNLVTNATWNDFWLNEGFTVYLERRIVEALYGPDRAAMEAVLGMQELRDALRRLDDRDETLVADLSGRDPDENVNAVPYEKGALFLVALEVAFGREALDAFLRGYFDHFAFQSITTDQFQDYLVKNLFKNDRAAAASIDLNAWLHEPGLPELSPEPPPSERLAAVEAAAERWAAGAVEAGAIDTGGWSTQEWLRFLRSLPAELPPGRMAELDSAFDLTGRGNAEVVEQWLLMAVRSGYRPADDRLEAFLTTVGRRKFIVPLYEALAATPGGLERARAIYAKARPRYHPIAVESIDAILKIP